MQVNMNQAATSGTKPRAVAQAIAAYLKGNSHQSAGRGGDELEASKLMLEARLALGELFGVDDPSRVIFTSGATEGLNMAINGLVCQGGHVLATGLEHNAVARPLHLLQQQGRAEVSFLPCAPNGTFDPGSIIGALRPNTRLLVMTHASNVLGNLLPVREAFRLAKQHGLLTLLDAAQTAGHMEVVLDEYTDLIAFTGHKGLRGVAGTGGLILNKTVAKELKVWKAGGTGSRSDSLEMPAFLPDRLEPGTPNLLGIIGLTAAARAISATGFGAIHSHEQAMTTRFVQGLRQLPVTLYGSYIAEQWLPVISMNIPGTDAGALARRLGAEFGIQTRSGLHCSPLAHQTIGTFPAGTLRFSFGAGTTPKEIDYALQALKKITAEDR